MKKSEYLRQINRINKYYASLSKGQHDGRSMLVIQRERNERLAALAKQYHENKDNT